LQKECGVYNGQAVWEGYIEQKERDKMYSRTHGARHADIPVKKRKDKCHKYDNMVDSHQQHATSRNSIRRTI
jgi:hypothetical protein